MDQFQLGNDLHKSDWLAFIGTYFGTLMTLIAILFSIKQLQSDLKHRDKQFADENRHRVLPCLILIEEIIYNKNNGYSMEPELNTKCDAIIEISTPYKGIEERINNKDKCIRQVFSFMCINDYPVIGLEWFAYFDDTLEKHDEVKSSIPVCSTVNGQKYTFEFVDYSYENDNKIYCPPALVAHFKDILGNKYIQFFILETKGIKSLRVSNVNPPELQK